MSPHALRARRDFQRLNGWLDTFAAPDPDPDAEPDADAALFHLETGDIDHEA